MDRGRWGLQHAYFGGTVMDFNTIPPDIYYEFREMNFFITNASICDKEGELQFYTNGIYISNKNNQVMQNGLGINPGAYADEHIDVGYAMDQGGFIIPCPGNNQRYYIFHAPLEYPNPDIGWHCSKLYYTLIDVSFNNGLGKVLEKNQIIVEDTLGVGKLTAVRHANGRDWWILIHKMASNAYYRILLSSNGVQNKGIEMEGNAIPDEGVGQAVFSPDGSKFIRMNSINFALGQYVDIYDFDRCSGYLSNHIRITYNDAAYAAGVAISPNSRYLYVSSFLNFYQYDLKAAYIPGSRKKIATYDGFLDNGISTPFYLAQLAPDGKIYINVPNGVRYLHVIHQPDSPGTACKIEQHGVHLPTYNAASLPNFPNYRLGPLDGSPCDTLGLDNVPVAKFRYEQDTIYYLNVHFTDLSYYEPATRIWDFGDGSFSGEPTPFHSYTQDGVYEVCLTVANANGMDTYCRTLQMGTTQAGESKPDEVQVTLFPNPCTDGVNVILPDYLPRQAHFLLYDATGRKQFSQRLHTGWNSLSFPNLAKGLYFYEITEEGRRMKAGTLVKAD